MPALRALCEDRIRGWYTRANAVDAVVAAAQAQGDQALGQDLTWAVGIASDEHAEAKRVQLHAAAPAAAAGGGSRVRVDS